jgi:hypothetical protein
MRRPTSLGIVSVMMVASMTLAGCGTAKFRTATTATDVSTTITIDPSVGETFAPPPADASPALTAAQAWAAYTQVDTSYGSSQIPANVSVELGLLTLPLGPSGANGSENYTADNELVYGFSWHNCPASRNPKAQTLPPNPCVEWNFLDANSGSQIDETWQMSN